MNKKDNVHCLTSSQGAESLNAPIIPFGADCWHNVWKEETWLSFGIACSVNSTNCLGFSESIQNSLLALAVWKFWHLQRRRGRGGCSLQANAFHTDKRQNSTLTKCLTDTQAGLMNMRVLLQAWKYQQEILQARIPKLLGPKMSYVDISRQVWHILKFCRKKWHSFTYLEPATVALVGASRSSSGAQSSCSRACSSSSGQRFQSFRGSRGLVFLQGPCLFS